MLRRIRASWAVIVLSELTSVFGLSDDSCCFCSTAAATATEGCGRLELRETLPCCVTVETEFSGLENTNEVFSVGSGLVEVTVEVRVEVRVEVKVEVTVEVRMGG